MIVPVRPRKSATPWEGSLELLASLADTEEPPADTDYLVSFPVQARVIVTGFLV
jgi:hypothetical protein